MPSYGNRPLTCFKCHRCGHMAFECRSSPSPDRQRSRSRDRRQPPQNRGQNRSQSRTQNRNQNGNQAQRGSSDAEQTVERSASNGTAPPVRNVRITMPADLLEDHDPLMDAEPHKHRQTIVSSTPNQKVREGLIPFAFQSDRFNAIQQRGTKSPLN